MISALHQAWESTPPKRKASEVELGPRVEAVGDAQIQLDVRAVLAVEEDVQPVGFLAAGAQLGRFLALVEELGQVPDEGEVGPGVGCNAVQHLL